MYSSGNINVRNSVYLLELPCTIQKWMRPWTN